VQSLTRIIRFGFDQVFSGDIVLCVLREIRVEEEVTKEKFKYLYFTYAKPGSGWTEDYWKQCYETKEEERYFVTKPETEESTRMFIVSGNGKHRMIFLTDKGDESFFTFPGKE
jgi:hypothetical protein